MAYAIEVTNVEKVYANGTKALENVNVRIESGDFFALLGANGAGKTTLIGVVSGLVNKTGGKVVVNGFDLDSHIVDVKMQLGIVPQEFNFNIFETVENVVLTQAGFYGVPLSVARPRAEKILTALNLWEKHDQPSRNLSGGMKRRLMIARALIHEPKILLLDEPTAGVDVELRHGMWEYLTELNKQGVTILLTTHYLEEVEQLCRNVTILHKGKVVREGTVADVSRNTDDRTWILHIENPPANIQINGFPITKLESGDFQVVLKKDQAIDELFAECRALKLHVTDIHEEGNRLERLMLDIIGNRV